MFLNTLTYIYFYITSTVRSREFKCFTSTQNISCRETLV